MCIYIRPLKNKKETEISFNIKRRYNYLPRNRVVRNNKTQQQESDYHYIFLKKCGWPGINGQLRSHKTGDKNLLVTSLKQT